MNNYFFSFLDGLYGYNCCDCNGLCCNLNGSIYLTKGEYDSIITPEYQPFCNQINNSFWDYRIKTPKRCWFLNKGSCSLKVKPIMCKLYPVILNDNNFFELQLCPCLTEENIIYYNEIQKIMEDTEWSFDSKISPVIINQEIKFREYLLNEYHPFLTHEAKIISLFSQVRLHSSIINETELNKNKLFIYYKNFLKKFRYINNYQNLYLLAKYNTLIHKEEIVNGNFEI